MLSKEIFDLYYGLLAPTGTWIQIGIPKVDEAKIPIDFKDLVLSERRIVGSMVGPRQRIVEMLDFASKHKAFPICEFYDFEDFPKAFEKVWKGRPKFRCIVKVNHNIVEE